MDRKSIPIFTLIRCYGVTSEDDFKALFSWHPLSKNEDFIRMWKQCFMTDRTHTIEEAREFLSRQLTLPTSYRNENQQMSIDWYLYHEMLPHTEMIDGCTNDFKQFALRKTRAIAIIILELAATMFGFRQPDDRDHYRNKRMDTPGVLFQRIFKQAFKQMTRNIRKSCLDTMKNNHHAFHLPSAIKPTNITNQLIYCLSTGNWGVQKRNPSTRTGISQQFSRRSYLDSISYLRRTNTPTGNDNKKNKQVKVRELHNTQSPFICPFDTPEGEATGFVKNIAIHTRISIYIDPTHIYVHLSQTGHIIRIDNEDHHEIEFGMIPVFVNGVCYGFIHQNHIGHVFGNMIAMRRDGYLPRDIGISLHNSGFDIRTDAGRMLTPLFICRNGKILGSSKNKELLGQIWDDKNVFNITLEDLQDDHMIEYLDIMELETKYVATHPKDITSRHTHCIILPSSLLSVSTSNICFSNSNQSPRNTYQSNMGKQAMSIYANNYRHRFDKSANVIWYPQQPLVKTLQSDVLGIDRMGHGQNLTVAVMVMDGYNMDDAIIWNEKAGQLGCMNATIYRTYTDTEKRKGDGDDTSETFCNPMYNTSTVKKKHACYDKIDDADGLPSVGAIINPNDVLIGKTTPVRVGNTYAQKDSSTIIKSSDAPCTVDRVAITDIQENGTFVRTASIRVRQTRVPKLADKFSSKHGQKGTIGMIVADEDMPFTADGIRPTVIINAHCMPSRMTIGQLIEMIASKYAAVSGQFVDGTAFSQFLQSDDRTNDEFIEHIGDYLTSHGFNRHCKETMYDGRTGEVLKARIFIAPSFYQRLKWMVDDKAHARSTGAHSILTRQPAEGRSVDGGLRFGEMERDCLIAHGSAALLVERMCKCSDQYRTTICKLCGLIGIFDGTSFECKSCDNTSEYAHVEIPYAFKLLIQEMMAINIAMRLRFRVGTS